jgi:hypothetical protein
MPTENVGDQLTSSDLSIPHYVKKTVKKQQKSKENPKPEQRGGGISTPPYAHSRPFFRRPLRPASDRATPCLGCRIP